MINNLILEILALVVIASVGVICLSEQFNNWLSDLRSNFARKRFLHRVKKNPMSIALCFLRNDFESAVISAINADEELFFEELVSGLIERKTKKGVHVGKLTLSSLFEDPFLAQCAGGQIFAEMLTRQMVVPEYFDLLVGAKRRPDYVLFVQVSNREKVCGRTVELLTDFTVRTYGKDGMPVRTEHPQLRTTSGLLAVRKSRDQAVISKHIGAESAATALTELIIDMTSSLAPKKRQRTSFQKRKGRVSWNSFLPELVVCPTS